MIRNKQKPKDIVKKIPFSQATFLSLKKGEEYTLTIKTLVNGQPVGQITEKFNTSKLKNLHVKELTEDEGNKKEEEETPAPLEEDEGTYLEEIAEEKEKEADIDPPTDILEMQKLSKRMRGQNERVSLEVVDEKANDSSSKHKVERNRSTRFEIACVGFSKKICYNI